MEKIIVKLADDRKLILNKPSLLDDKAMGKDIILVFNNLQVFDGEFIGIDEEGDFDAEKYIMLKSSKGNIGGFPYHRLLGWTDKY